MNVTPRSTQRCSVASDSVSSTSPETGVNAIAPKPIALTDNSSPSVTTGTELAFVIVFPNEISAKLYSSTVLLVLLVLEYSFANFGDHWHQANGEIADGDPRRSGGNEQFHRKCHGGLHGRALRPVPSLVGAQPGRDVVTERVGQREGTHHCQARPVAEQRDTRRGVADQADASARPRRYLYPADRVEVQVVGDADAVQQLGHAPPS